ncbi:MAG: hypothetical protein ACR2NP_19290 [Pirellulaceae bacterium]
MVSRLVSFTLVFLLQILIVSQTLAAQHRTRNFVVNAADPAFARQVGEEAERFRKELAILWLGKELPDWPEPCPIRVEIGRHAGGETSFAFVPGPKGSQPIDWRMKIFGPPDRLLDSVLPHEVTHTIFATHYGRPLPRWADEGGCTTVEHEAERKKNHQMLIEFLSNGRGIPFNHMFAMKQYPRDILPLYAQGYSLARYLIMQKGHRHFVDFVGEGMDREQPGREPQTWNDVTEKYYGYQDLSDLQIEWLGWVKQGCPHLEGQSNQAIAQGNSAPPVPAALASRASQSPQQNVALASHAVAPPQPSTGGESWYVQQSRQGGNAHVQRPEALPEHRAPSQQYFPGSLQGVAENPDGQRVWR